MDIHGWPAKLKKHKDDQMTSPFFGAPLGTAAAWRTSRWRSRCRAHRGRLRASGWALRCLHGDHPGGPSAAGLPKGSHLTLQGWMDL